MLGPHLPHELAEIPHRHRLAAELRVILGGGSIRGNQIGLIANHVTMSGIPDQQPCFGIVPALIDEVLDHPFEIVGPQIGLERDLKTALLQRIRHSLGVADCIRKARPAVGVRVDPDHQSVGLAIEGERRAGVYGLQDQCPARVSQRIRGTSDDEN